MTSPHLTSPAELKERIEAGRAGLPFLVYRRRDGTQAILTLTPGEPAMIGRSVDCRLCIAWDPRVSALHAELYPTGGHWVVADDGLSRNGTYLNGDRVTGRHRLKDGDQLEVGATTLLFREPGSRAVSSTVVAATVLGPPELSPAQRRVLVSLCRPYRGDAVFARPATNQQIAEELVLSVPAVKTHLRGLFQRFGVGDLPQNEKRAALVRAAFDRGAVTPADL